ncbi:hypothetical protein AMECASPLE_030511, partial [Ameca splendens]
IATTASGSIRGDTLDDVEIRALWGPYHHFHIILWFCQILVIICLLLTLFHQYGPLELKDQGGQVAQVTLQVKEPLKNSSDNNLDSDRLFLASRWPWWFLRSFQANPVHPPLSCQDNLKLQRFSVATL